MVRLLVEVQNDFSELLDTFNSASDPTYRRELEKRSEGEGRSAAEELEPESSFYTISWVT